MATYRELHGKAVKTVTTNPSDDAVEGQIWFNSTDNTFKSVVALEAWTSASPMLTSRNNPAGQGGTQNASWICGGNPPAGTATEEFNGTGWSSSGNLNNGRLYGNGAGTQTAAITIAGDNPTSPPNNGATVVEEYNGSSWTAGTAIPEGRYGHATCGAVKTAVIAVAGDQNSPLLSTTKEWNGSSWSEGGAYPAATFLFNGTGTSTAGLCATGSTPPQVNTVATYDGSSWTTTTNYPSTNQKVGMAGAQTAALCFGGSNSSTNTSFKFDGSTFTATPNMATSGGAFGLNGSSPQTTTLTSFGPGTTEEFNQSATVITAAAWSSGGALNQRRRIQGNAGGKDAGLSFGGYSEPGAYQFLNVSEEYNGTSWTEGNNLNLARYGLRGLGTQTAAVAVGGQKSGTPTAITNCENYDGTSWTNTGAMNVAREEAGVFGIQTAGVACGGFNGAPLTETNATENFDGSSWTASGTLNSVSYAAMAAGTQTAGVRAGGYLNPTSTYQSFTEEYNGSSWTSVNSMPEGRGSAAPSKNGTQTAWQFSGGRNPGGIVSNTMAYDGTNWATGANISTARTEFDGGGTTSGSGAHLICGGQPGSSSAGVTTTEEFTAETTALNVKTLTQS